MEVETGTTRGIIKVTTDDGIVGIGETYGGNAVEHAIEVASFDGALRKHLPRAAAL